MMRLVLVRHGETEHNRGQLTLGRADVPLNERGLAQAAALGRSFVEKPDAVFASPLQRAAATARQIADAHGMDVLLDDRLIEMDVGEMEHLTRDELGLRYRDFLVEWMSDRCGDARMPGGETLREVQERAWSFVADAAREHAGRTVVAVSHNFVILMLICRALGLPIERFRRLRQTLASRTIIDVDGDGGVVVALNDVSHLVAHGLADDERDRRARSGR